MTYQANKLFVGGLPYSSTTDGLIGFFETFGEVSAAEVLRNHKTGASRGFGFVAFTDPEVALNVFLFGKLSPTGLVFGGKRVQAKFAVPREGATGAAAQTITKAELERKAETWIYEAEGRPVAKPSPREEQKTRVFKRFTSCSSGSTEFSRFDDLGQMPMTHQQTAIPSYHTSSFNAQAAPFTPLPSTNASRTLVVRGFSSFTPSNALRQFFSVFGEVFDVQVVNSWSNDGTLAYVLFASSESVEMVINDQRYGPLCLAGERLSVGRQESPREMVEVLQSNTDDISLFGYKASDFEDLESFPAIPIQY